jgi:putative SOS response-associated peptidase YedK
MTWSGPIHAQAMPVMLTSAEEHETWLSAPAEKSLALHRPLPDDRLMIVATGTRTDQGAAIEMF